MFKSLLDHPVSDVKVTTNLEELESCAVLILRDSSLQSAAWCRCVCLLCTLLQDAHEQVQGCTNCCLL